MLLLCWLFRGEDTGRFWLLVGLMGGVWLISGGTLCGLEFEEEACCCTLDGLLLLLGFW